MRKSLFILPILLIFIVSNPALAEVVDLIQLDDTTHNYIGGSNYSNSIDGNWSTVYSASYDGGNGGGGCSVISEHTLSRPYDIETIKYRLKAYSYDHGSYDRNRGYSVSVETRDENGSWTTVPGTSSGDWTGGSGAFNYDSGERELTGLDIQNVIAIRASASAGSSAAGGNGRFYGHTYIYEIQAYGVHYDDIGIRVKTNTKTVKIGVEDLDETRHKLRIRKGNTTYGIPLLATDDNNASPVRIYDGNEVKALPKID